MDEPVLPSPRVNGVHLHDWYVSTLLRKIRSSSLASAVPSFMTDMAIS